MAALTQDKIRQRRGNGQVDEYTIATGQTVYIGSLVTRATTSERVRTAAAGTNRFVVGIAEEFVGPSANGVGNTAGTEKVRVRYLDEHLMTIATAIRTTTSLSKNVFVGDDDTVAGTGVGTAGVRVKVGELVRFEASNKSTGWVAVRRFGATDIS